MHSVASSTFQCKTLRSPRSLNSNLAFQIYLAKVRGGKPCSALLVTSAYWTFGMWASDDTLVQRPTDRLAPSEQTSGEATGDAMALPHPGSEAWNRWLSAHDNRTQNEV